MALLELFSLQNDPSAPELCFPMFLDGFWTPKRVLELNPRFGAISALREPKIVRVAGAV